MQITMFERARPAWPTKTKLRINGKGNRDGEWNFCRRREADMALFLQVTRIRKIRTNLRIKLVDYTPRQDDHPETITQKQTKRIEIH